ncbi:MAG: hypothetical protein H8E28_05305 [Anaerolineae bacterium]|nr:hypothetical protein [Anaerolineae bacterium]
MDFFSGLALILLTLVGYSSGVTLAGKNKALRPFLLDVFSIIVLWIGAIFTRDMLGKWLAVLAWFLAGMLIGSILTFARKGAYPDEKQTSSNPQSASGLRLFWERWKVFAAEMGNFQSRMLLAFFYFIVVAPFGIFLRLLSDPLQVKHPGNDSLWAEIIPANTNLDEARKQF